MPVERQATLRLWGKNLRRLHSEKKMTYYQQIVKPKQRLMRRKDPKIAKKTSEEDGTSTKVINGAEKGVDLGDENVLNLSVSNRSFGDGSGVNASSSTNISPSMERAITPRTPILDGENGETPSNQISNDFSNILDSDEFSVVPATPGHHITYGEDEIAGDFEVNQVRGEEKIARENERNEGQTVEMDIDGLEFVTEADKANFVPTALRVTMKKIKKEDIENVNLNLFKNKEIISIKVGKMCHAQRFWLAVKFCAMKSKEKTQLKLTTKKICNALGVGVPGVNKHILKHKDTSYVDYGFLSPMEYNAKHNPKFFKDFASNFDDLVEKGIIKKL